MNKNIIRLALAGVIASSSLAMASSSYNLHSRSANSQSIQAQLDQKEIATLERFFGRKET